VSILKQMIESGGSVVVGPSRQQLKGEIARLRVNQKQLEDRLAMVQPLLDEIQQGLDNGCLGVVTIE